MFLGSLSVFSGPCSVKTEDQRGHPGTFLILTTDHCSRKEPAASGDLHSKETALVIHPPSIEG
jgi:hypothetical protein